MKTEATYFQNNKEEPVKFGEVEIFNKPSRRLRGEPEKEGILCRTVCAGFCGTDYELMKMGMRSELASKFPAGTDRLINGHEGVVYIPSQKRFAIVLIRGGNSYDPTRFMDDETYFEYGCDQADGLMSRENYYHPDMLLKIPDGYITGGKIPVAIAKRLVFSDPYACMIFQLERMEDLGEAQNFRLEMAVNKCSEEEARKLAKKNIFSRVVIFGLGTTGMFIGELIRKSYPESKITFVGRGPADSQKVKFTLEKAKAQYVQNTYASEEVLANAVETSLGGKATVFIGCSGSEIEHRIAFEKGVLGNNGIYNSFSLGPVISFKSMQYGFKNHLVFGSINFRQDHMEKAIKILCESDYDRIVELVTLDELKKNPKELYENRIYAKGAPLKSAVIWAPELVDFKG